MTEADLRPLLDADPFEPFTLHLTGRTSYDIDRPERVGFSPDGGLLNIHGPDGRVTTSLALYHVVRITFPDPPIIRRG